MDVWLERSDTLAQAQPGWDKLAEASGNIFSTWDWADTWWRHFSGSCRRLMVRRARTEDGRVAAILPLYVIRRGPLTAVRLVGHGPADELGPICGPVDRPLAAHALRVAAAEMGGIGLLLADRLPADAGWLGLLGGRRLRHENAPVLRPEGRNWEDWLAARSRNFRQQLRRRERRLVNEHRLAFRLTQDPGELDADLDALMALHAARWGREGPSAFTVREAFHRDFARRALASGRLRLWLAEVDGRAVAAWYGFRFARREIYYQAGRDPAWDDYAVGSVLLAHSIRTALDDRVLEYRFGLGDEPYKARFATTDPGLETLALGHRGLPEFAAAAAAAARRLPPEFRRERLRRIG